MRHLRWRQLGPFANLLQRQLRLSAYLLRYRLPAILTGTSYQSFPLASAAHHFRRHQLPAVSAGAGHVPLPSLIIRFPNIASSSNHRAASGNRCPLATHADHHPTTQATSRKNRVRISAVCASRVRISSVEESQVRISAVGESRVRVSAVWGCFSPPNGQATNPCSPDGRNTNPICPSPCRWTQREPYLSDDPSDGYNANPTSCKWPAKQPVPGTTRLPKLKPHLRCTLRHPGQPGLSICQTVGTQNPAPASPRQPGPAILPKHPPGSPAPVRRQAARPRCAPPSYPSAPQAARPRCAARQPGPTIQHPPPTPAPDVMRNALAIPLVCTPFRTHAGGILIPVVRELACARLRLGCLRPRRSALAVPRAPVTERGSMFEILKKTQFSEKVFEFRVHAPRMARSACRPVPHGAR